jgi:hypothetical protein
MAAAGTLVVASLLPRNREYSVWRATSFFDRTIGVAAIKRSR